MKEFSNGIVVDATTGKKHYVPPQVEVVELDKHAPLLAASDRQFGARFNDIERDVDDEW